MNAEPKAALLSFVHDDGKGFIGVHSAAITFADWPEYREMIGGFYDEHPWVTFDAPIVVEDASFPRMQQWPKEFVLKDEIYQIKDWSRRSVRVNDAGWRQGRPKKSAGTPQGSRFSGGLGKNVWKGTRVLVDVGTPKAKLG